MWSHTRSARRAGTAILLVAVVGGHAFVVRAQGDADAARLRNPIPSMPESIAAGKQLYQRNCATCHGTSGEGGPGNDLIPAAPSLVDGQWDHGSTDGEIFSNIRSGIAPDFNMVPFKDKLKDEEIWTVVVYIRSIAKEQRRHDRCYFASGSGRTWNLTSLLVVPFPPST